MSESQNILSKRIDILRKHNEALRAEVGEWKEIANEEQTKWGEACTEVVELESENAVLRADNAMVVKYARDLIEWVEIWATGYPDVDEDNLVNMFGSAQQLKHVLQQSGKVATLLKELKELREVAIQANILYEICADIPIDFPGADRFTWTMGELKDALQQTKAGEK
jgi:hypothetical protein